MDIFKNKQYDYNDRGRPCNDKLIYFTPQPKSIVSLLLTKQKSMNQNVLDNLGKDSSIPSISQCSSHFELTEYYKINNYKTDIDHYDNMQFTSNLSSTDEEEAIEKDKQDNFKHIFNKIGNKEVVCQICKNRSNSFIEHKDHMKRHKQNDRFFCNHTGCTYSCNLSSNLIKHIRVHTSEKPYLCDECSFRSNFINSLKVHKRIHSSERPYTCKYCEYKCNSSSNLKKHNKHRHQDK